MLEKNLDYQQSLFEKGEPYEGQRNEVQTPDRRTTPYYLQLQNWSK